jgi:hypothetical protein
VKEREGEIEGGREWCRKSGRWERVRMRER